MVSKTPHAFLLQLFALFLALCSWPSAQAQASFAPTRMQRCAAELGGIEGAERKRLLRECLVVRLDAERMIERDCRQQVRAQEILLPGTDRQEQMGKCTAQALAVSYIDLPRRPVAVGRSAASASVVPEPSEATAPISTNTPPAPVATVRAD